MLTRLGSASGVAGHTNKTFHYSGFCFKSLLIWEEVWEIVNQIELRIGDQIFDLTKYNFSLLYEFLSEHFARGCLKNSFSLQNSLISCGMQLGKC